MKNIDLSQYNDRADFLISFAENYATWNDISAYQFKVLISYLIVKGYEFRYDPSLQFYNLSNYLKKIPISIHDEAIALVVIADQILGTNEV